MYTMHTKRCDLARDLDSKGTPPPLMSPPPPLRRDGSGRRQNGLMMKCGRRPLIDQNKAPNRS